MNDRGRLRNEIARCINRAAHATRTATKPWANVEGCKKTAHDYIVKAIAARDLAQKMGILK